MAKCQTCTKGLLAEDRKRGRCGRCGLSIHLPTPTGLTAHERQLLCSGKGPLLAPSIEPLMANHVCNECRHGRHAKCQDLVMWFCHCWRNQHEVDIEPEEEFENF
jgi:hypothetical protein